MILRILNILIKIVCTITVLGVVFSCSIKKGYYYTEKVECFGNYHYFIIHLKGCKEYNPLIKNTSKISEFAKMVYDKYCPVCMSEDDVAMFDAISKRNISKIKEESLFATSDRDMQRLSMYDEDERGYELYYVYNEKTHNVEEYMQSVDN